MGDVGDKEAGRENESVPSLLPDEGDSYDEKDSLWYRYKNYANVQEEDEEFVDRMPTALTAARGTGESSIRVQKFPVKLYVILAQKEFRDIITWMPHGRAWKVLKPSMFESLVMPLFFEYSNYHSFNRLVNAWSFRRVSSGPDRGSYYHELFLRGKPHLQKYMRRLPKTHKKLPMRKGDEPDFYRMDKQNPLPQVEDAPIPLITGGSSSADGRQGQQQQQHPGGLPERVVTPPRSILPGVGPMIPGMHPHAASQQLNAAAAAAGEEGGLGMPSSHGGPPPSHLHAAAPSPSRFAAAVPGAPHGMMYAPLPASNGGLYDDEYDLPFHQSHQQRHMSHPKGAPLPHSAGGYGRGGPMGMGSAPSPQHGARSQNLHEQQHSPQPPMSTPTRPVPVRRELANLSPPRMHDMMQARQRAPHPSHYADHQPPLAASDQYFRIQQQQQMSHMHHLHQMRMLEHQQAHLGAPQDEYAMGNPLASPQRY